MQVYIPLSPGQEVAQEVLDAIKHQSVPCKPILVHSVENKGIVDSQRIYSEARLKSECEARRLISKRAMESGDEFCVMMDRDIVMVRPDTIERALSLLTDSTATEVVFFKGSGAHEGDIGVGVWRTNILALTDFLRYEVGHPLCKFVEQQVKWKHSDLGTIEI